jgi:hypothetical protein
MFPFLIGFERKRDNSALVRGVREVHFQQKIIPDLRKSNSLAYRYTYINHD